MDKFDQAEQAIDLFAEGHLTYEEAHSLLVSLLRGEVVLYFFELELISATPTVH